MKHFKILLLCLTLFFSGSLFAEINPDSLLSAEKAFIPSIEQTSTGQQIKFKIANGYYLYQSRFTVDTEPKDIFKVPEFSPNFEEKQDQFLGQQKIYHHNAYINLNYQKQKPTRSYNITLQYQGCASAGVCYPPQTTHFKINAQGQLVTPQSASLSDRLLGTEEDNVSLSSKNQLTSSLSSQHIGLSFAFFFLAGLGLSFTACMYPLLPIVSGVVLQGQDNSRKRAFLLSLVYVQGLAWTYALVGVIAGVSGALLTVWLQQEWVTWLSAGIIVVLALSMFGVLNLQMPLVVQNYFHSKNHKLSGGRFISVFLMGIFSALVVGPCMTPPLAAALGYIAQSGDALRGASVLYALALGTGTPLIIVATFGVHYLPRAGAWMNIVKIAFGFLLLGTSVYIITPYLSYWVAVGAYAILLIIPSVLLSYWLYRYLHKIFTYANIISIALLALAGYFISGSLNTRPTAIHEFLNLYPPVSTQHYYTLVSNPTKLNQAIQQAFVDNPNEPVMVDFYADWCVSCKEMEALTYSQKIVQEHLNPKRFFKVDVTKNTPAQRALLRQYGLFGPPGLFLLKSPDDKGRPLVGFATADELLAWIDQQRKR